MSGIGHNRGPGLGGTGWTRYCWDRARADLFPKLPVEVVRLRVKRAAQIGLDYRTYAGIRATTGHDLAAFLYSTNMLRLLRDGEAEAARVARLAATREIGHLLAVAPGIAIDETVEGLGAQGLRIDTAAPAPSLALAESHLKRRLAALRGKIPADRILVIAETGAEAEWASYGRMAATIGAESYFAMAGRA